jgi:type VI secretion system protein ImpA
LEYDADFGELERAAQPVAEQQFGNTVVEAQEPDWKDVRGKALDLFGRTKDLRVAVLLARATVRLDGLAGFRDALALLRGLVERFWKDVHPQLDPEDDLDPAVRVNTLAALCDNDACLKAVLEAAIVESSALGTFAYRDYLIASGEMPPRAGREPVEMAALESAFTDSDPQDLLDRAETMAAAVADAEALESALTQEVGTRQSTSFDPLTDLLKKISRLLAEQVERRGLGKQDAPPADAAAAGAGGEGESDLDPDALAASINSDRPEPPPVASDEVRSRDDVIRLLDKICDYYRQYEPSSPVPLLLRRAKRVVTMDFIELLRELVPSGLSEAEAIGGSAGSAPEGGS